MPPQLALFLCILIILYLLFTESNNKSDVTIALLIPLMWFLIIGSRPLSAWLDLGPTFESPADILEGSPFDRAVFTTLIVLALYILLRRNIDWSQIVKNNIWIVLLLLYAGISTLWSDFHWVSFKRWIKAVGEFGLVLVVLTEPKPSEALVTMIRRGSFILIPLSVLLIKYYPDLGKLYGQWEGDAAYSGVAVNKNFLGILCMICGLIFVWSLFTARKRMDGYHLKKEVLQYILLLGMIFWLFIKADSATSFVCFILGCCIVVGTGLPVVKKNVSHIGTFIFVTIGVFLLFEATFDVSKLVISSMGRDMTLTGRTELWSLLIDMQTNPLIGTGFESFWLGERAQKLWDIYWWRPNEAHNGYLETYLNLGWIGLLLLLGVIISCWRKIRRRIIAGSDFVRLQLAFFCIALLYNITEAGFRELTPMWFMFLLIVVDPPHHMVMSNAMISLNDNIRINNTKE